MYPESHENNNKGKSVALNEIAASINSVPLPAVTAANRKRRRIDGAAAAMAPSPPPSQMMMMLIDENVDYRRHRRHLIGTSTTIMSRSSKVSGDVGGAYSDYEANLVEHVPSELNDNTTRTVNCSTCFQPQRVQISQIMEVRRFRCVRCQLKPPGTAQPNRPVQPPTTFASAALRKQLSRAYFEPIDKTSGSSAIDFERRLSQIDCCCRSIVLDWMADVCMALQLSVSTYYLAVSYFDRILIMFSDPNYIHKQQMQSLGCACLFTASKVEETDRAPSSADFCTISDNVCTRFQLKQVELKVVNALDWKLRPITADCCLLYLCQLKIHEENEMFAYNEFKSEQKHQQHCLCQRPHCKQRKIDLGINKRQPPRKNPLAPLELRHQHEDTTTTTATQTAKLRYTAHYYSMCTQHYFEAKLFNDAITVMNLAHLDIGYLRFTSTEIAIGALSLVGYAGPLSMKNANTDRLNRCVQWLRPFHTELVRNGLLRNHQQRRNNNSTEIPERFPLVQIGMPKLGLLRNAQNSQEYAEAAKLITMMSPSKSSPSCCFQPASAADNDNNPIAAKPTTTTNKQSADDDDEVLTEHTTESPSHITPFQSITNQRTSPIDFNLNPALRRNRRHQNVSTSIFDQPITFDERAAVAATITTTFAAADPSPNPTPPARPIQADRRPAADAVPVKRRKKRSP